MTTPTTPGRDEVDPPPIPPYTYGLLSVAQVITADGRWQIGGVEYPTDACAEGQHLLAPCPAETPLGPEGVPWVASGAPFTVRADARCNAVGFRDPAGTAERRLRLVEPIEVERVFSTEILGAPGARLPLGDEPVPLLTGLGALEQDAILHYGGQPVLHSPRWTQPHFAARQVETVAGPVLRTRLESQLAFGAGYYDDPHAPADPDPRSGQWWLYATGTVTARRTLRPAVQQVFEPRTNRMTAVAERTYALDHDCYRAAVLVTVTRGES